MTTKELDKQHLLVLLRYFSVPSALTSYYLKLKPKDAAPDLDLALLFFLQNALTDLRQNFYPLSIKPINLPTETNGQAMPPYDEEDLEVNQHKAHLKDRVGRYLPFLLSLTKETVPFCVLTRYLVLNVVTGMFHLYQFDQSEEKHLKNGLFAMYKDLKPQFKRDDTPRYLHHYFERALQTIGEPKKMFELNPLELLIAMREYWHLTACAQDTLAICLEVQQLFLYVKLYRELRQWHKLLPKP